ncbi:MAG TPA: UbiD family decarboxylase [Chloroflexota bacterium]|nr:UbiD family decarboxylase [Chloroflexota bacterium]
MPKDLRTFLDEVGDRLLRVRREVDPLTQLGELVNQAPGPIMFENVRGYPGWRIVDLLTKPRWATAIALGTTAERVVPHLADLLSAAPGEVVVVDDGPCKEVKLLGDDADLTQLPIAVHSVGDGGDRPRYIGGGMCVTKDVETGIRNMAMLRLQVKGPRRGGVLMVPRHTYKHFEGWEARGEPMPMAVAIGCHPAFDIACNWSGRYGVDEFGWAASFLGEPVPMVRCETIAMEVPAYCEIVIEGVILAGVREEEGPFGEFQGYSSSGTGRNPVFEVRAITMRRDAIYRHVQSTVFTEHQRLVCLPMEAGLYQRVRDVGGGIDLHDVYCPPWGGEWLAILQLTAHFDGQVKDALMAALSSPYLHPKIAVAVDRDVDIFSAEDVWWAVATRCDPQRDTFRVDDTRIHPMDIAAREIAGPGGRWQRLGGKIGIDATKPSTFHPEERALFERARAEGFGQVRLEDFLAPQNEPAATR